ncbi:PAS domain-containing protein [Pirellulaceae bacterium SH501]
MIAKIVRALSVVLVFLFFAGSCLYYFRMVAMEQKRDRMLIQADLARRIDFIRIQEQKVEQLLTGLKFASKVIDWADHESTSALFDDLVASNFLSHESYLYVLDSEGDVLSSHHLFHRQIAIDPNVSSQILEAARTHKEGIDPSGRIEMSVQVGNEDGSASESLFLLFQLSAGNRTSLPGNTIIFATSISNFLPTSEFSDSSTTDCMLEVRRRDEFGVMHSYFPSAYSKELIETYQQSQFRRRYSIADMDWVLRGKSEVVDSSSRQARGVLWAIGTILIGILFASFLDRLVRSYGTQLSSIQRQLDIAAHKTSEGLWYWDVSSKEFWYNDRLCHLLQRMPPRILEDLGAYLSHVVCELDRLRVEESIAGLKNGEKEAEFDFRIEDANGDFIWRKSKAVPFRDSQGKLSYIAGSVLDIDGERAAGEQLKASEYRWKFAVEGNGDGLWDWNIANNTVFFSDRWKEMIGYSASELADSFSAWVALIHPDDVTETFNELQRHFRGETRYYEAQFRMQCKDLSWKWILARGVIVRRDENGDASHMIGTHSDISVKKESELHTQQLASIVNCSGDAILRESTNGRIETWNHGAEILFGYSASDVIGQPLRILFDSNNHTIYEDCKRALASGEVYRVADSYLVTKEKELRAVSLVASPIFDSAGKVVAASYIFHDIADFKNTERELLRAREYAEQANRGKSEFLANMSHEIRTPMTAIIGYASILREELEAKSIGTEASEHLEIIQRNGKHLLSIINDILDISKIEAGRLDVEVVSFSIERLLAEVIEIMQGKANEKEIGLQLELEPNLPSTVASDPTRLRQILINLVGNAIKFTHTGGVQVHAKYDHLRSELIIQIRDTGIGMTPKQVSQLFRPFHQADATTSRKYGGTGLGLSISKRLAGMLGGDVTVESELHRGSCFTLTVRGETGMHDLPDATAQERLVPQASERLETDAARPQKSLEGIRILLAEDGLDNQRLIAFFLKKEGAVLTIANDGLEALSAMRLSMTEADQNPPFDLLLTDIQMPNLDGIELTKQLRSLGVQIPIVALTANAMKGDSSFYLECGCDCYLAKPIDRKTLVETCRQLTASQKMVPAAAGAD